MAGARNVIEPNKTKAVAQLTGMWNASGIRRGDTVLIHSSLSRLVRRLRRQAVKLGPHDILKSFQDASGRSGTLLFPLFNFGFARGEPFDIRHTPSEMGVLTEAARTHPEAVRTGHPIYSFAVLGYLAGRFCGIENFSGYGPDSPFAVLRDLDGKIAVLDLADQDSMTFYHHVEEMEQVPYRYHKKFYGSYTGFDGIPTDRSFGLFVRDLKRGVVTEVNGMGERLWQLGLYEGSRPGEASGMRVIKARALYDATGEVIRSGVALGMLYNIEAS